MTSPAPTPAPPPGQDKVVIVLSSFLGVGVLAVALNMLRGKFIRKDPLHGSQQNSPSISREPVQPTSTLPEPEQRDRALSRERLTIQVAARTMTSTVRGTVLAVENMKKMRKTPGHDEDDHQPLDPGITLKLDEKDLGEIQKLRAELEYVKQSNINSNADIQVSSDVIEAITSDLRKAETKAAMACLLDDVRTRSANLTAPVIDTREDHFDLMISYRVKTEAEMAVRLYEKICLNPNADLEQDAQNRCPIPQYARKSSDTGNLGPGIARTFLDAKHIPDGSEWEQVFVKAGMRVHSRSFCHVSRFPLLYTQVSLTLTHTLYIPCSDKLPCVGATSVVV